MLHLFKIMAIKKNNMKKVNLYDQLNKKFPVMILQLLCVILFACSKNGPPVKPPSPADPCIVNDIDTCAANLARTVSISLSQENQIIHSFGASDCWGIKFVGKNWPVQKREQIADLLFSKEMDVNGNPKGIGLSMWRINVGAGSYEQGTASKITSDWRREECFLDAAGNYDWSKQAGSRWFAQAAKARGVENMLLFSIAPPVQMSVRQVRCIRRFFGGDCKKLYAGGNSHQLYQSFE
jgi:hypothetical protein